MSDSIFNMINTLSGLAQDLQKPKPAARKPAPKKATGSAEKQDHKQTTGSTLRISPKDEDQQTEQKQNDSKDSAIFGFSDMGSEDILRGIVFSEILGKPKALRRGRW